MRFNDPEVQKAYDQAVIMDVGLTDPDQKEVLGLMGLLDRFKMKEFNSPFFPQVEPTWTPRSPVFQEVIAKLTDPIRRNALRKWYTQIPDMNPSATALRDALSTMVGEELRPQPPPGN